MNLTIKNRSNRNVDAEFKSVIKLFKEDSALASDTISMVRESINN